jgi:nucleoside 2-deoxyribosyltransferase
MKNRVYLAGPITGLSYDDAVDWRKKAKSYLKEFNINAFSPLRGKEFLSHIKEFKRTGYDIHPLSTNRGIMTRDRFDCTNADVLLVNFLGAQTVSIGTVMEIAWADAHRIPIVCCMEGPENPHFHGMILEAIGYRFDNLKDALDTIIVMLNP